MGNESMADDEAIRVFLFPSNNLFRSKNTLACYIYTGRVDTSGELKLAMIARQARLRTALGRMIESANAISQERINLTENQLRLVERFS